MAKLKFAEEGIYLVEPTDDFDRFAAAELGLSHALGQKMTRAEARIYNEKISQRAAHLRQKTTTAMLWWWCPKCTAWWKIFHRDGLGPVELYNDVLKRHLAISPSCAGVELLYGRRKEDVILPHIFEPKSKPAGEQD